MEKSIGGFVSETHLHRSCCVTVDTYTVFNTANMCHLCIVFVQFGVIRYPQLSCNMIGKSERVRVSICVEPTKWTHIIDTSEDRPILICKRRHFISNRLMPHGTFQVQLFDVGCVNISHQYNMIISYRIE